MSHGISGWSYKVTYLQLHNFSWYQCMILQSDLFTISADDPTKWLIYNYTMSHGISGWSYKVTYLQLHNFSWYQCMILQSDLFTITRLTTSADDPTKWLIYNYTSHNISGWSHKVTYLQLHVSRHQRTIPQSDLFTITRLTTSADDPTKWLIYNYTSHDISGWSHKVTYLQLHVSWHQRMILLRLKEFHCRTTVSEDRRNIDYPGVLGNILRFYPQKVTILFLRYIDVYEILKPVF